MLYFFLGVLVGIAVSEFAYWLADRVTIYLKERN